MMVAMEGAKAGPTPTGCYKCGRPGHWSRDCPSASALPPPSSIPSSSTAKDAPAARPSSKPSSSLPRKRPKLTPDLLLSEHGLGYVLERFPRMVRVQGRGHEVEDLGSLLEAYMHWHSRILPYFSFEQFVEKLEKVGATKRVRVCIHELREKVNEGAKPDNANASELPKDVEDDHEDLLNETSQSAWFAEEIEVVQHEDAFPTDVQEEFFEEIYKQATEEEVHVPRTELDGNFVKPLPELPTIETGQVAEAESYPLLAVKDISEEQRARMEANRSKAQERAKSRTTL